MRFPNYKGEDGVTVDERHPRVRFTSTGEAILENTPVEVPVNWNPPETIEMTIARMVRSELSSAAQAAGFETLDEAYDFDMDGDDSFEEHLTPAEIHAMMHAPEMREERPISRGKKEKQDVRERAGSGPSAPEGSGDGVVKRDDELRSGGAEEYARDGKGARGKDEALRVRRGSESGDGKGT